MGTSARNGEGLDYLMDEVSKITENSTQVNPLRMTYSDEIEKAVLVVEHTVKNELKGRINSRWVSLKLLDGDESLLRSLKNYLGYDIMQNEDILQEVTNARHILKDAGISQSSFRDQIITRIVKACESISKEAVTFKKRTMLNMTAG